jgi:hypothetical protein
MGAMWKRSVVSLLLLLLAMGVCGSCESTGSGRPGDKVETVLYNRYNIHYSTERNPYVASYINLTSCAAHEVLPYNSACTVRPDSTGFMMTIKDAGMKIRFIYNRTRMGGMSVNEYIDLILSPTPVSYSNLTALDEQGIKAGRVMVGMSKQGVLIALGYPAKHKTPSTDLAAWYYWKNKYAYYWVNFDGSGKVTSLSNY